MDLALLGLVGAGYTALTAKVAGIEPGPARGGPLDVAAHLLHAWSPVLLPAAGVMVAVALVYTALFAMLWSGRTPGRFVSGIRLVDRRGAPPGPVRALLRAVLAQLSWALLLGGFWWGLFDRRGQTLHDKLTRTFVVQPLR